MDQINNNTVQSITLRNYCRTLLKRRLIIISIFLSLVTAGAIYTFTATPIYKASAQVLIEKTSSAGSSMLEMMLIDTTGQEFYETQQKILESRKLAREVNKRLDLAQYPEFQKKDNGFLTYFSQLFKPNKPDEPSSSPSPGTQDLLPVVPNPSPAVIDDSSLVAAFKKRLKIELVPNTRILNINFESADPNLAAMVVNTLVRAYTDWHLEVKVSSQKNFSHFLDDQVKEFRKKNEQLTADAP